MLEKQFQKVFDEANTSKKQATNFLEVFLSFLMKYIEMSKAKSISTDEKLLVEKHIIKSLSTILQLYNNHFYARFFDKQANNKGIYSSREQQMLQKCKDFLDQHPFHLKRNQRQAKTFINCMLALGTYEICIQGSSLPKAPWISKRYPIYSTKVNYSSLSKA